MPGNRNILSITVRSRDFFRSWVTLTSPLHNLTSTESDIFAAFLRHRHELSRKIKDTDLLDKVLMNEEIKRSVREECGVKGPHFQVIMGRLRKKGVLRNGRFVAKLIPNLDDEHKPFGLTIVFDMKDEEGNNKESGR